MSTKAASHRIQEGALSARATPSPPAPTKLVPLSPAVAGTNGQTEGGKKA